MKLLKTFIKKIEKKFNLIKLSQVLEHVSNPLNFLKNIMKLWTKIHIYGLIFQIVIKIISILEIMI